MNDSGLVADDPWYRIVNNTLMYNLDYELWENYATKEDIDQALVDVNSYFDDRVFIYSLPGISASKWTYNEELGEDVLYKRDWTFSSEFLSK